MYTVGKCLKKPGHSIFRIIWEINFSYSREIIWQISIIWEINTIVQPWVLPLKSISLLPRWRAFRYIFIIIFGINVILLGFANHRWILFWFVGVDDTLDCWIWAHDCGILSIDETKRSCRTNRFSSRKANVLYLLSHCRWVKTIELNFLIHLQQFGVK